jgi:phosphate-selective porin OprO/OprP
VFYRAFGNNLFGKVTANYNNAGQFEIGDSDAIYSGFKTWTATAGIFKPAYSLEYSSKRYGLAFMERALPVTALSERRSGGVSFFKRTPKSILNAGLYLFSPDEDGQREKGQALVLHYVHAPLEENRVLGRLVGRDAWVGASMSYRTNAESQNTRFRSRPEVGITDQYFVDTGAIDGAESILRFGFEANKVDGAFSWQAEFLAAQVQRDQAGDVRFTGGYLFASWFLTGESRNYNSATGEFRGVTPQKPLGRHGWGAFELAVRASTVNLNDQDIIGGRERNLTFGLNWYLNDRFRLQGNLIKVLDLKRPGSEFDGEDPWIAAVRLQFYLP